MSHLEIPNTQTVLYATAESANHAYLQEETGFPVVASARALSELDFPHMVVVPACTGRDLTAITQAAQALQWLQQRDAQRTLILGEALSGATYAIARMRHHIRRLAGSTDAVMFISATVDPFADAELFRRVRLAQQFSENVDVSVAFDNPAAAPSIAWPQPEELTERLHTLGHKSIQRVRADLYYDPSQEQLPLFKNRGLTEAIVASDNNARHRAQHGHNGIAEGLLADHGAGFAHSHGDEHGHSHPHPH